MTHIQIRSMLEEQNKVHSYFLNPEWFSYYPILIAIVAPLIILVLHEKDTTVAGKVLFFSATKHIHIWCTSRIWNLCVVGQQSSNFVLRKITVTVLELASSSFDQEITKGTVMDTQLAKLDDLYFNF